MMKMNFRKIGRTSKRSVMAGTCALLSVFVLALSTEAASAERSVVDAIVFGDAASEESHALKAELGQSVQGALGESARRLLPPVEDGWRGGRMTFSMEVDPVKPNYFTAKFWGGETAGEEVGESRLNLFIEGKQVGQRHLGEVDMLDIMWSKFARYPGRFFYKTVPLPVHLTKGKTSIEFAIEAQGGINGYAHEFDKYQKNMTEVSRGIYRAYVHTEALLAPEENEVQGKAPENIPVRPGPGPELLVDLKETLNNDSNEMMAKTGDMHVDEIQYLGYAYHTAWNTAYHNPKALERIVEGMDRHYLAYREDPDTIEGLRWVHKGPAGDGIRLVYKELAPYLDTKVEGTNLTRREAWSDLLIASRDYNAARRRSYTNQSMIVDVYTYYCDLGARVLGSPKAWPEEKANQLFYESMGLEPWSGSWDENGTPDWSQGRNKMLLTDQGLTKELGYVGFYGEIVSDFGVMMYEATKSSHDDEGDPRLKEQLVKMSLARAPFRYPLMDSEGYRSMNLEAVIGWRDWHYPGSVFYDQVNGRDGGSFHNALATGDQALMGYGQQMVEDNQFFVALEERMKIPHTNSKTRLLAVPEHYEKISSLPPQEIRLPMTDGQPDFVFADTVDGVIAVKNGDDILYASLYWRARHSINNLARVHYLTPTIERDAIVNIETRFDDSGHVFTLPDWTNLGFARGRLEEEYRAEGMHFANAGQTQPIAVVPSDDTSYKIGGENLHAGKGDLYIMSYGQYFVAMNCTEDEAFEVDIPDGFRGSKDLVSGKKYKKSTTKISAKQTLVLYRED